MDILKKINYLLDKKTKKTLVFLLFAMLIGAAAELVGVSIIQPIVDLAMESSDYQKNKFCKVIIEITKQDDKKYVLLILVLITVFIYVVKNCYLSWMNSFLYKFAADVKRKLATNLMKSYLKQPYAYFLYKNSSELIRNINEDTGQLYQVILNVLMVVSNIVTSIAIIILLATTNLGMTITVAVLMGLCAVVIIFAVQTKTRQYGRIKQKQSGFLIRHLQQVFEGIKEIKILNTENYFMGSYDDTYYKLTDIQRKSALVNLIPKYLIETVCITGIMGYLAINIAFNQNYASLIPQLSVFVLGAFKLLPCVNATYAYCNTIIYHKASIDLVYNDIKETEGFVEEYSFEGDDWKSIPFEKSVCVKNLAFQYEGADKKVLQNVSLEIRKGESVALVGPSGGGKTTLADLILGLLKPIEGQIFVDNLDIQSDMRGWRKNIGYIPQTIYLTDDTIRNNIAFGVAADKIDDAQVWKALEDAQLKEFIEKLPEGLDTEVGERGVRISGGQRQRIGIARALYRNPQFLVFDEATSALDNETEKEVMNAIDGLHGNKTILMIAHRLSTIENCDHVFRVEAGAVKQEK